MRLIFAALLAVTLLAQPPAAQPPKPAAARPAPAPDRNAFTAANSEKDPALRAAALEKFLRDFPSSNMAPMARRGIVSALVAAQPEDAVRKTRDLAASLPAAEAAAQYRTLAMELNGAGKLPAQAENAARQALKLFRYDAFAAQRRVDAEDFGRPAPAESQMRARFAVQRAQFNETLAQVLESRGQAGKAIKVYRQALQANPASTASARSLAAAEEKAGHTAAALGYYAQALLARPSAASRQRFYEAWQKAKGGPDGAEAFLDRKYRELFPNPLHAAPFRRTAARSNRLVLAEVYTGAGCPPCVGADLAFEAVLERYPRSDVAVLMYHEHIPRPDPLTNNDTLTRWKWQQGRGVPTYAVDGEVSGRGGGGRDSAPELESYIRAFIEKQLETPAGAALELKAANDGRGVRATARVASISKPNPNLVLNLALVEKDVRYSGENGIRFHPMVVRRLHTVSLKNVANLQEAHAFSLPEVAENLTKHLDAFEKHDDRHNKDGQFRFAERKDSVDPAGLAVVAFVQDSATKEVLQAAWADAPKE